MAERLGEVVVIGLGRFGAAIAETLIELHYEVLGIDPDPRVVEEYSTLLTHLVEADATDAQALRQLGVADFSTAVVAIGDIEASILTTACRASGPRRSRRHTARSSSVWAPTTSSRPSARWASGSLTR